MCDTTSREKDVAINYPWGFKVAMTLLRLRSSQFQCGSSVRFAKVAKFNRSIPKWWHAIPFSYEVAKFPLLSLSATIWTSNASKLNSKRNLRENPQKLVSSSLFIPPFSQTCSKPKAWCYSRKYFVFNFYNLLLWRTWKLKLLPKIKIFIWKLIRGKIPTRSYLRILELMLILHILSVTHTRKISTTSSRAVILCIRFGT